MPENKDKKDRRIIWEVKRAIPPEPLRVSSLPPEPTRKTKPKEVKKGEG